MKKTDEALTPKARGPTARPSMVKADCLNPSHGGKGHPVGMVTSPTSDGADGRTATAVQPASEPTLRERETTSREPNDGAKGTRNLGIAYVPRGTRRRRNHSTQMLSVTGETRGRILESLFQSRKVDPDESNDLRTIGTPAPVEQQQAVGKP